MRGIDHDGVPVAKPRDEVVFQRRYISHDELSAELQRHAFHDAIGNAGWSTDLSVHETQRMVALMRTVDGCEAFRMVSYPPIREYHVPIPSARSASAWTTMTDPSGLPPLEMTRRTYRLKAIERQHAGMLMRAVYEEVL